MIRQLSFLILCSLTTLSTGCARGFDLNTPDGFAELDQSEHYRYRATNAEGVVIAVRREKNEPQAGLDFWSKALDNELLQRGYTRLSSQSVKSKNGTAGKQLRYRMTRNGRPNVLWLTVFVAGDRLVVIEAGGDETHFEGAEAGLRTALESFEVG